MPEPFKRVLITAALPYNNGRIHIGHLAGCYIPADIYHRHLLMSGVETLFVCGSDEHGVAITLKAIKEGVSPREIIDRYHPENERAFKKAGMSFDIYGRTSWPEHIPLTQHFFTRLSDCGHIASGETVQYFSEKMQMFLPDRYVEGTCPRCHKDGARGDQCDHCGSTYDVTELLNPRSALPGDNSTPVRKTTRHWSFQLDHFEAPLKAWLATKTDWRPNVLGQAKSWLTPAEGAATALRPRQITRDTDWGVKIPVADADAANKRIYVWFDAPIGYITNTKVFFDRQGKPEGWKPWWQDPATRLVQFMGKDNIVFHTIIFPAMLMGQQENYILPDNVVANEFLNIGGEKGSKSKGTAPPEVEAIVDRFGADRVRYYFTANAPEGKDSEFTWEDFRERTNGELADVLGNFIHRTVTFTHKNFEAKVPVNSGYTELESAAIAGLLRGAAEVRALLDTFRFRQALSRAVEVAREGNRAFDALQPWVTRKQDLARCATSIHCCLQLAAGLTILFEPFVPEGVAKIRRFLNLPDTVHWSDLKDGAILPAGAALDKPVVVFEKLTPEQLPGAVPADAAGKAG
ncbi:MAG: methionine--tRNA ligase [Planctomycetota bacterium]